MDEHDEKQSLMIRAQKENQPQYTTISLKIQFGFDCGFLPNSQLQTSRVFADSTEILTFSKSIIQEQLSVSLVTVILST